MSKDYSIVVETDDDSGVGRQELEFQDFSSSSGVGGKIAADKQASSSNRNDGFNDPFPSQTRTEGQSGQPPMWAIEYYAQFFDVDTNQVLERAFKSILPKESFIEVVGPNPDLYGPFWIPTTFIFLLFVTSTIAGSLQAILRHEQPTYDFQYLSFAASVIYTYTFLIPLFLWAGLKYLGCKPSLLDTIGVYGYGLTIWLPISVAAIVPSDLARWILVGVGFGISGFFMTRNLYPVIARADSKTSRIIVIFILAAHAGLAILLKYEFFTYKSIGEA